jgi:hypothetical protein
VAVPVDTTGITTKVVVAPEQGRDDQVMGKGKVAISEINSTTVAGRGATMTMDVTISTDRAVEVAVELHPPDPTTINVTGKVGEGLLVMTGVVIESMADVEVDTKHWRRFDYIVTITDTDRFQVIVLCTGIHV